MNDYEKILRDFIKAMMSVQSEYNFYYNKVNELDKSTSDLLHQFELGSPKDRSRFSTQLSNIRKERRYGKDQVAVLAELSKYAESNQPQIKALERLLGEVRKEKKKLNNRTYTPRILKNLTMECLNNQRGE